MNNYYNSEGLSAAKFDQNKIALRKQANKHWIEFDKAVVLYHDRRQPIHRPKSIPPIFTHADFEIGIQIALQHAFIADLQGEFENRFWVVGKL